MAPRKKRPASPSADETPVKKRRDGRMVTESRSTVPAGSTPAPRCCIRCAKEYVDFPGLECWAQTSTKSNKCGDCARKKRPCIPVPHEVDPELVELQDAAATVVASDTPATRATLETAQREFDRVVEGGAGEDRAILKRFKDNPEYELSLMLRRSLASVITALNNQTAAILAQNAMIKQVVGCLPASGALADASEATVSVDEEAKDEEEIVKELGNEDDFGDDPAAPGGIVVLGPSVDED